MRCPRFQPKRPSWGFQSFADDWPAALKRTSPVVAGFALPFILIVYLAFNAGGYGVVVRSEIGLVAWWIVVVGSLCSVLPISRPTKQGAIALALLAALLAWTALSLIWTDSTARTVLEFARIATLLGVMSLAVFVGGRDSLRRTVSGAAAAIVVVAVFAVLSRFHPGWFPDLASQWPAAQLRLPTLLPARLLERACCPHGDRTATQPVDGDPWAMGLDKIGRRLLRAGALSSHLLHVLPGRHSGGDCRIARLLSARAGTAVHAACSGTGRDRLGNHCRRRHRSVPSWPTARSVPQPGRAAN